jgi:hypothetical protein
MHFSFVIGTAKANAIASGEQMAPAEPQDHFW